MMVTVCVVRDGTDFPLACRRSEGAVGTLKLQHTDLFKGRDTSSPGWLEGWCQAPQTALPSSSQPR